MIAAAGALAAGVYATRAVLRAGKPRPLLDHRGRRVSGSISEKVFVDINGAWQGMFIKGVDQRDPVLL